MKLFSALYERVMHWPIQPHAPRYPAGLSFPEHSLIPIKPDVMLALTKLDWRPYTEQIGWILVMLIIAVYFILNSSVNG